MSSPSNHFTYSSHVGRLQRNSGGSGTFGCSVALWVSLCRSYVLSVGSHLFFLLVWDVCCDDWFAECNTFSTSGTCNGVSGCEWDSTQAACTCASNVTMDVFFSLDASGSIGYSDFQVELDWVVDVLESAFGSNTRHAFNRFASSSSTLMHLPTSEGKTTQELQTFVSNIAYTGGGTNTAASLDDAIWEFETYSSPYASRILILITDGNPTAGDLNVCSRAPRLKQLNVVTIIIGVGSSWDPALVDCLVTSDDYMCACLISSAFGGLRESTHMATQIRQQKQK